MEVLEKKLANIEEKLNMYLNRLDEADETEKENTDSGLPYETTEKAKELLEVKTIEAVADKGYESKADILNCLLNGTAPTVALKLDKTHRTFEFPYEEKELRKLLCKK